MSPQLESALLVKIGEGDQAAFTLIFDQYQGKLYTAALHLTRSAEIAEELVQDVFLKTWLKRRELTTINSLGNYLFIMLRNEAYDWLSREARRRQLLQQMPVITLTEEFLQQKESSDLLQKAIRQLPAQQQQVFRLIREQGMSRDETAAALGIDPNTVKTHLSRALKSLRAWCLANGELGIVLLLINKMFL